MSKTYRKPRTADRDAKCAASARAAKRANRADRRARASA